LLEKERIMQALWPDTFVEEANLANLVALLRKTLGDSPANSGFIQTVPRRGYRFVATVLESEPIAEQVGSSVEQPAAAAIRIIVFPFRTNADDAESEDLAYGVAEALAASLAEL